MLCCTLPMSLAPLCPPQVTKTTGTHVQLYFAEDNTIYWFSKKRALVWMGGEGKATVANKRSSGGGGACGGGGAGGKAVAAPVAPVGTGGDFEICEFASAEEMKSTAPPADAAASATGGVNGAAERDATACQVCRGAGDDSLMLLCDGCNDGYHTFCFDPPMKAIPEGQWFCPSCERVRTRAVAANW